LSHGSVNIGFMHMLYSNIRDTSHLIRYVIQAVIMISLLVSNTHLLQGCQHSNDECDL
jgi:hypothetical protein